MSWKVFGAFWNGLPKHKLTWLCRITVSPSVSIIGNESLIFSKYKFSYQVRKCISIQGSPGSKSSRILDNPLLEKPCPDLNRTADNFKPIDRTPNENILGDYKNICTVENKNSIILNTENPNVEPNSTNRASKYSKFFFRVTKQILFFFRRTAERVVVSSFLVLRRLVSFACRLAIQFLRHPIKTPRLWCRQFIDGIKQTWIWLKDGSKLFYENLLISSKLIQKRLKGHPLSFREHKLLVRTSYDIFKLVPFSLFIIIPFAEFLLPFVVRLYPQILPSTFFERKFRDNDYLAKKLKAKQELAKFFQEIIHERTIRVAANESKDVSFKEKAEKLRDFQVKLMSIDQSGVNPLLSFEETLALAKLFKTEIALEKMSLESLKLMCRLLGLHPYSTKSSVIMQLRHYLLRIQKDDREILWEGVHMLSHEELVEACKERAMRFHGISDDQMRQQMLSWLELSSNKDIPPLLLLWSRCITMTHSPIDLDVNPTPDSSNDGSSK